MAKKRGSSNINIVFDNLDSESNTEVLSKINELVKFIEQKTGKEFSDILSHIKTGNCSKEFPGIIYIICFQQETWCC